MMLRAGRYSDFLYATMAKARHVRDRYLWTLPVMPGARGETPGPYVHAFHAAAAQP